MSRPLIGSQDYWSYLRLHLCPEMFPDTQNLTVKKKIKHFTVYSQENGVVLGTRPFYKIL